MRKVNDMFHIEGERLIKTSNGDPIPDGEPIFILRGRDVLAVLTVAHYIDLCIDGGVPADRVVSLMEVFKTFKRFQTENAGALKTPGVTHGK